MSKDLHNNPSELQPYHELSFCMFAGLSDEGGQAYPFEVALREFERGTPLERALKQKLEICYQSSERTPESFTAYADRFYLRFSKETQVLLSVLESMLRLSRSNSLLSIENDALIAHVAKRFSFPLRAYESIREPYVRGDERYKKQKAVSPQHNQRIEQALSRLGLPSDSDEGSIRSTYRRLALLYHPDVYASVELSDEILQDLHDKFREIQESYEVLIAEIEKNERT